MRKFASLFYKINTFFQKNTTYIRLQTEQIADRENFIIDKSWSSAKLFIVQDYTENANGDVPLIVEDKWYFQFLWVQGAYMHTKIFLFHNDNEDQLR